MNRLKTAMKPHTQSHHCCGLQLDQPEDDADQEGQQYCADGLGLEKIDDPELGVVVLKP